LTRYESSLTDGICVGEKRFLKSLLLDVEVVSMLFSRLSILSGVGYDWWLDVEAMSTFVEHAAVSFCHSNSVLVVLAGSRKNCVSQQSPTRADQHNNTTTH
jgi:hypothetical protein